MFFNYTLEQASKFQGHFKMESSPENFSYIYS